MKKYIHWVILITATLIHVFYFKNWENFIGFSLFLLIMVWNIYAFLNNKNMIRFPGMADSIKTGGDEDSRVAVFIFSCIIIVVLCIGWVCTGGNG